MQKHNYATVPSLSIDPLSVSSSKIVYFVKIFSFLHCVFIVFFDMIFSEKIFFPEIIGSDPL